MNGIQEVRGSIPLISTNEKTSLWGVFLLFGGFSMENKNLSERAQRAKRYFAEGYNCAQAMVLAFADVVAVPQDALLKISSSFGGGMGRLREVCGAVSGMFMVLGLLSGYDTPETGEKKKKLYAEVQELAHRVEEENGSIVCRELLALKEKRQDPTPDARTPQYYQKRPCLQLVAATAEIFENYLKEQGLIK